jgi:hypothetical protein
MSFHQNQGRCSAVAHFLTPRRVTRTVSVDIGDHLGEVCVTIDAVRSKVQRILTDMLGSVTVGADGIIILHNGSTAGIVDVVDWGDGDTIVKITSPMLSNVRLTPEVYEWVATEGQNKWFAHARVARESETHGRILWEYDLLGNSLDPDELKHAVSAVMVGADEQDDELQKRFGGTKVKD